MATRNPHSALHPRGYHHGDARRALVEAATALLAEVGVANLSLRQVAERAGLSRQAPYNHFANKEALLAELVREGFERLGAAIDEGGSPAGKRALERAADAYIRRAQEAPALFRLMFSCERVDLSRFPEAAQAASAAYGRLEAIVATFAPPGRAAGLALAAWSLVHGYATLCIEIDLEPDTQRATRAREFARIIRAAAASRGRTA